MSFVENTAIPFEGNIGYQIRFLVETFGLDRAKIAEGFNCVSGFTPERNLRLVEAVVRDAVGGTAAYGAGVRSGQMWKPYWQFIKAVRSLLTFARS